MRGRGSQRLPTSMVESFSTDLPARKIYWRELLFELYILLGGYDTKLLHMIPFLLEWGEEIDLFCVCVAETIIIVINIISVCVAETIIIVINIIVYCCGGSVSKSQSEWVQ